MSIQPFVLRRSAIAIILAVALGVTLSTGCQPRPGWRERLSTRTEEHREQTRRNPYVNKMTPGAKAVQGGGIKHASVCYMCMGTGWMGSQYKKPCTKCGGNRPRICRGP